MSAVQPLVAAPPDPGPVVLATSNRSWCDRVEAALRAAPDGQAVVVLRLSEPPEARLPLVRGVVWVIDEAWLAPLLARQVRSGEPFSQLSLILLFEHPCSERIVQAIEAGARGCLAHDADPAEVLRAVQAVRAGELWLGRKLFARVLSHLQATTGGHRADEIDGRLTERQRQIAACVAEGLSNKQIGRQLGISPTTVKTHLHNIFERIGVGGRTLLALRGAEGHPGGAERRLPGRTGKS